MSRVLRCSSQFAQDYSGAEAPEYPLKTALDDTSTSVEEELLTDLDAANVSLPDVSESQ